MLYCALSSGQRFGWGTLGSNLPAELAKRTRVTDLNGKPSPWHRVPGAVLHTIRNHDFETEIPCRGERNIGYGFWEFTIPPAGIERSKRFDLIFAGSTWGSEHLAEFGMGSKVLLQGIDPDIWHPVPPKREHLDYFVVASIGKFELRKGQDIALAAMKVVMDRHKDVLFVNAWENKWRGSMEMMEVSRFIEYRHLPKHSWEEQMAALYMLNHMHPGRIVTHPLLDARTLKHVIQNSDLGLFANRCEAGTNLALMEYMACGRPVVASLNSGHKDVLTKENAIRIERMEPFEVQNDDGPLCRWDEPDIDETIEHIEFAYQNRDSLKPYGTQAAKDMKRLTWGKTAETLLQELKPLD